MTPKGLFHYDFYQADSYLLKASKPYKPQAVFRTRQTSGFFMSKFCRSFFLTIKKRFEKTQCREGEEYNTRKGNNSGRTCGGFRTSWHPI